MTAIKKLQVYQTSDGSVYEDENEALRHQAMLDSGARVDDYLNGLKISEQAKARRKTTILEWVAYEAGLPVDVGEEDTPKKESPGAAKKEDAKKKAAE